MKKCCFLYLLLGMFVFLSSCEEDVELNFEHQPQLCFNSILNPDSLITARLTLSKKLDTLNTFQAIEGARISLTKNGVFFGDLEDKGDGNYFLDYSPLPGEKYGVTVSYEDFPVLSATALVPEPPVITYSSDTIEYNEYENFYSLDVNYQIHDKQGRNSYWLYQIFTDRLGQKHWGPGGEINAPFVDDFDREVELDSKYGFDYKSYIRISDEGYDGQIMSFNMSGITRQSVYYFLSADEHYDKYIKSSVKANLNTASELPFREPVQIYSNIENGYGIFGSCAITAIHL